MRKLNNKTHYPDSKPTDMQHVTTKFFGLEPLDTKLLVEEAESAAKIHEYTQKAFTGWTSLPLRSLHGMTGEDASDAVGEHASSDADKFMDTPAMQPYIKSLVERVGGRPLKVRLMKMRAHSSIGEHRDNFNGDGVVVRFHIPIVTHPKVQMSVNGKWYHMKAGELYRVDVSQRHAVVNSSSIDRIHLVFDIVADERVTRLLE